MNCKASESDRTSGDLYPGEVDTTHGAPGRTDIIPPTSTRELTQPPLPACDLAKMRVLPMAGNNKANRPITVRGLIIPMDWDDRGNVTGVAISTSLEEEYRIELNRRGEELLSFIRERVKASGKVSLDAQGDKVMMVDTYQILE